LETRRTGWAVLAGAGAAAAMLGKYWSIFPFAGLVVAAFNDRRRGEYFRSPAPWLTIGVGAVLLAPHLVWVFGHDFEPLRYAFGSHPVTYGTAVGYALLFFACVFAYIAAPVVLNLIATRPTMVAIGDSIWPPPNERRTVVIALAAPLVLAAFGSILLKIRIAAIWTMSGMTLLPVVLLSSPLVAVSRTAAVRLLALAVLNPAIMVAASPGIALIVYREGVPNYATHYHLIALAAQRAWSGRTDKPLRIVGSYSAIVNGIVFYFENQPSTLDIIDPAQTPWVDDERIRREGAAIVCPVLENQCMQFMSGYAARYPNAQTEDVSLARRYFGALDKPVQYRFLIIPPQAR
jgi:hypothetical protein